VGLDRLYLTRHIFSLCLSENSAYIVDSDNMNNFKRTNNHLQDGEAPLPTWLWGGAVLEFLLALQTRV